jgi:hypothetical protein
MAAARWMDLFPAGVRARVMYDRQLSPVLIRKGTDLPLLIIRRRYRRSDQIRGYGNLRWTRHSCGNLRSPAGVGRHQPEAETVTSLPSSAWLTNCPSWVTRIYGKRLHPSPVEGQSFGPHLHQ